MKKEDVSFLMQLVSTLEEVDIELESAYVQGDINKFNRVKKFIMQINQKISEVLK
mgnify:CR=1 FL=1